VCEHNSATRVLFPIFGSDLRVRDEGSVRQRHHEGESARTAEKRPRGVNTRTLHTPKSSAPPRVSVVLGAKPGAARKDRPPAHGVQRVDLPPDCN
jgi:hypothetical protein